MVVEKAYTWDRWEITALTCGLSGVVTALTLLILEVKRIILENLL